MLLCLLMFVFTVWAARHTAQIVCAKNSRLVWMAGFLVWFVGWLPSRSWLALLSLYSALPSAFGLGPGALSPPSLLCRLNSRARLMLLLTWRCVYQWDVTIAAILPYSFQVLSSSNGVAAAKHRIWPQSGELFPRLWILHSVEASGKVVTFSDSVFGFTNSKQIFFYYYPLYKI